MTKRHSNERSRGRNVRSAELTPDDALHVLGLPAGAGRDAIRKAYRRLAFEHHPDRNQGSAESFVRFKRITLAYKVLEQKFRLDAEHAWTGICDRCGRYVPLRAGLDRNQYCRECMISARGRRILPAPVVVVAGCGFAIVTLMIAVSSTILCVSSGRWVYGAVALGACVAALVSLAATAITVGHAIPARGRRE